MEHGFILAEPRELAVRSWNSSSLCYRASEKTSVFTASNFA